MEEPVQKDQWYAHYSYLMKYLSANSISLLCCWDKTSPSKFYRVTLVLKVQVAILAPLVHRDLKEALVSLVSKDNW